MLLVKTKIKFSKIHGIGLFADEFIKKGTVIWKYQPKFDQVISESDFNNLPELAKQKIIFSDIKDGDSYVILGDDSRFFNHSETPNTIGVESEDGFGNTLAKEDINAGVELTADYREFDDTYAQKIIDKGV